MYLNLILYTNMSVYILTMLLTKGTSQSITVLYLSFATCNSCYAASCNKLYWNSQKFLRKGSEPVSHQAKRPLLCQRSPLLSPCSVQAQLISCRNALAQIKQSLNLQTWTLETICWIAKFVESLEGLVASFCQRPLDQSGLILKICERHSTRSV